MTEEEVRELARVELGQWNELRGWSFGFDRARRRAGLCDYQRRRISVSRYLLGHYSRDEIHQVILHEVAHALSGKNAKHGPRWREAASRLGYRFEPFSGLEIAGAEASWLGLCPAGHRHYRYQRPQRESSCAKCARVYDPRHRISWSSTR